MARSISADPDLVLGLREHLTKRARDLIVRLDGDESGRFTAEVSRLRRRLDDLLDGADVIVYRHEIPRELEPPRDGRHVFTLHVDRLVHADYQRVRAAR